MVSDITLSSYATDILFMLTGAKVGSCLLAPRAHRALCWSSFGREPCTRMERYSPIWRYDAPNMHQRATDIVPQA